MKKEKIGSCGAFCGTCPEHKNGKCKGCTTGYANGERDISKARCKVKVCCVHKGFSSCADCDEYDTCPILLEFHGKSGYKYGKYKEALEYIRAHGYRTFLDAAAGWTRQYGKLE